MKMILLGLLFINTGVGRADEIDVVLLRQLFYDAATKESAATRLIKLLEHVNDDSEALLIGYKGVSQLIAAKYALNPITKYNRFNKGKRDIETAVKKDPAQLEIRFLRFTIQTNLPAFLGYNQFISTDKKILINAVSNISDAKLKKNIVNYLLASKYCTPADIKKLKN
jgi:hypothetical protein